jgi:hypothetical protein
MPEVEPVTSAVLPLKVLFVMESSAGLENKMGLRYTSVGF